METVGHRDADWIPVTERFPGDMERVLAYYPGMKDAHSGPIAVGCVFTRDDGRIFTYGSTSAHEKAMPSLVFSHWMPLPSAPASKTGNDQS